MSRLTPPRKQSSTTKKTQRIESILQHAADLFEISYENTSMRDIGKRVGVDAATIYHYFPSKESILMTMLDQGATEQLAVIREAASTLEKPRDRLGAAVRSHLHFAVNSPFIDLQVRYFHLFSKEEQQRLEFGRGMVDRLFEQLLGDVAHERGRELADPSLLRNFCFGAMNDVRRWFRESGRLSIDDIADRFTTYIEILTNDLPEHSLE